MAEDQTSKTLTIEQRYEILQMLESGQNRRKITRKYGVSRPIVACIYAERMLIKRHFETNPVYTDPFARHISSSRSAEFERALYLWCKRCMKNNIEITGVEIQKKALELNDKLKGESHFKASKGWLQSFRNRCGISRTDVKRDFPIPTKPATDTFKVNFKKFLQKGEYALENVYNASYTAIMWKAVPEGTLIFPHEKLTTSQEICEDHVTILFCANATGCHKLPLLVIGRTADIRSSHNLNTNAPTTIYTANANAWMNNSIFNLWFEECFIKSVKERQEMNRGREKTLLLLGSDRSLPDLNNLNKRDKFVTVMSTPLDVTHFIQPMNCGIITCFKRKYRKELVKALMPLPRYNTRSEVIDIYEELNAWDCCCIMRDAWSYVEDEIMEIAWNVILKYEFRLNMDFTPNVCNDVGETVELLHSLPGCERCDSSSVHNWFLIDNIRNIITKVYTDKVIRDFQNKTLYEGYIDTVDDGADPSYAKFPRFS
ncbi:tigger transposable element-derived protein 2-like [Bombus pyrosoma]|uniref:tigger transposable element-derived protein 2-like n=1 Tax=Bombus pyrosoma TaxID=396416 RepID=UPI001CB9C640|nr:tigger transposable element-derived protein 2-like [Bombus pyrosoma]